jgi:hypothetical protein
MDSHEKGNAAGASAGKMVLYIAIGAFIFALTLIGGGWGVYTYIEAKKDGDAYERAARNGDKNSLENYLTQYPDGRYVAEAKRSIDDLDWQAIPRNLQGYMAYLKSHPNGVHAAEARQHADNLAWIEYGDGGSIRGMKKYLEFFPSGNNADVAKSKIKKKRSCNLAFAQHELELVNSFKGGIDSGTEGAENIYSKKQGTAYSNTNFSGGTATTYYHDGSYTSQDGIEVRYRISNNSKFLVFRRIEGEISFRTRSGALWRGVAGALIGGAWNAVKNGRENPNLNDITDGAKKGYDKAKHIDKVVISQILGPGEVYRGRSYQSAKHKVLNSDFQIKKIQAEISDDLVERNTAPGC